MKLPSVLFLCSGFSVALPFVLPPDLTENEYQMPTKKEKSKTDTGPKSYDEVMDILNLPISFTDKGIIIARRIENILKEKEKMAGKIGELNREKDEAIRAATLGKFIVYTLESLAIFETTWSRGVSGDPQEFSKIMSRIVPLPKKELAEKKHFRNWLWILVKGNENKCKSIDKLRKSLKNDVLEYVWFASQIQIVFEALNFEVHPESLLKTKYVSKEEFLVCAAETFQRECRLAIERYIENVMFAEYV